MPFHDKIIPREISDFTREVEDFVRPVTDPVRSFIAKAVPREIKPVLPFIASSMVPLPFMNFPGGQFLGGFGLDALTQKLMTDPEDEDTDIDYLSALMSGVARSTAAAAAKGETAQRFADPADYGMETVSGQRPGDTFLVSDPNAAAQFTDPTPENFVQKKDVTNFFKSQIISLKDQFENLKNEILSLNDHQKNELLTEVNLVLKNANNVIEKVDSESKIYKEKYFNDTIITEVKVKDIDIKLYNLD